MRTARWRGCEVPIVDGAELRAADHTDHLRTALADAAALRARVRELEAERDEARDAEVRATAYRDAAQREAERLREELARRDEVPLACWAGGLN